MMRRCLDDDPRRQAASLATAQASTIMVTFKSIVSSVPA
jgi:hypothetical protein